MTYNEIKMWRKNITDEETIRLGYIYGEIVDVLFGEVERVTLEMDENLAVYRDHKKDWKEEIDRLKGELEDAIKYCKPYGGNPRVCTGMQAHIDLERQLDASQALLAEARAENERLNSVDHYACALCPDVAQARQETAREIMQMIDVDITNSRMWVNEIRDKFKLEG